MSLFQECNCECCINFSGFPILWKLPDNKLWFEIPKNGTAEIKKGIEDKQHITNYTEYLNDAPYIILRDPVDRFISLLKHYFLKEGGRYPHRGVPFFKRHGMNINAVNVPARVEFVINNLHKLTTEDEVHHFYPQTHFIDKAFSNFTCLRMDEISPTFDLHLHRNKTRTNTKIQLTSDHEQYVKEIYKEDYVFFKQHNFKP